MTERSIDELGPVDYLVVEFPAGQQNFTGEAAEELLRLHDAGIIRVMDLVIVGKGDDGTIMAQELGDLENMGEFERLETELAETLAEEDVLALGAVMAPGSLGAVLVYENLWAAALRLGAPPRRRPARHQRPDPGPGHHRRRRGRRSGARRRRSLRCRCDPSRLAKAAVVTAAVTPGPSPVAKAAVVGAAVSSPGRGAGPVAKAAVVAAAVTPGRRRF